jgi:flagellar P-ring protein precursor FlgI
MLQRLGVNIQTPQDVTNPTPVQVRTKDIAAVMVTATLPAFATEGARIDVNVGAMGDAKSLSGGVLLVTPLLGADGEVYAVSQGNISVAGFVAQGQAASVTQGIPTSGRIPTGAIVERKIPFSLASLQTLKLSLRNPDITTAQRIAGAVAGVVGAGYVRATDPHTVEIAIPPSRRNDLVGLMSQIELLRVTPDQTARVVIDEKSGVIVMGENVRISTVAVAQGNLTIKVTETPQVSQPNAFSNGQTAVVPRTDIQVDDQNGNRMAILKEGATLGDVVNGLNALGVGPRDLISILQAIKAAGALQADIEVL